jgi:hypothetical protein
LSFIFTQTIPLSGPTYFGTVESKEKFAPLRSMKAYERNEVYLHPFLISALVEVSVVLHIPAATPAAVVQEAGWVSEPVWT